MAKLRQIDVEIGALVVDDPAMARSADVAAAVERGLARFAAHGGLGAGGGRSVHALSASLGREPSAHALGAAIAQAIGGELRR